jgi:cytoskeleton protein RodZ
MICSVGERLRQARLEQGLDLSSVVAQLKINEKYLKAIEADQRDRLPSAFFYKHFVVQYARALSLDAKEIGEEVDRLLSAEAPPPLPGQHEQVARTSPAMYASRDSSSRLYVSLGVLTVALMGCSGFYVWWHNMQLPARQSSPGDVRAVAKRTPASAKNTPPAASTTPNVERAQPQDTASPASSTATPTTAMPVSLATAQPGSPQPPSSSETTRLAAGYKVLLDLVARESTWLSISSDGRMVFTGILAPHETKTVEGKEFAKLRVGNAAGLDVRLNGRMIGPLGSRGQVLVVVFTPDNFQIVVPTKEGD